MRLNVLCGIALLSLFFTGYVRAQDTLSPGMMCYNEILADWQEQDGTASKGYRTVITSMLPNLAAADRTLIQSRLSSLTGVADNSPQMIQLYVRACSARRTARMTPYIDQFKTIAFATHGRFSGVTADIFQCTNFPLWHLTGGHNAYMSDYSGSLTANGRVSYLTQLQMNGMYGSISRLVTTTNRGLIRDIDVSFDGKRILFAWKKKFDPASEANCDNFHIYEMDVATKTVRQITTGIQYTDYEPCYLPNGDIMFTSTRNVQNMDCTVYEVPNMFVCDKDGKYLRRIGFDQVTTGYPEVLNNGEVIYTRWDYNDRNHTYTHGLFVMHPDGTRQREYYGNNKWFPPGLYMSRPIPNSDKVMAIFTGYHVPSSGMWGIIDNSTGLQEMQGARFMGRRFPDVSREITGAAKTDSWYPGDNGQDQYMYPYPFDETTALIAFKPSGSNWGAFYGLYFMKADGQRELLLREADGVGRMVPLLPRKVPPIMPSTVDYTKKTGVFTIENVYLGQSTKGVAPGTIKKLRVLGIEWRAACISGIGHNGQEGTPNASYNHPVARANGTWDIKDVIGEAQIYSDGSASFIVPARYPLYFQLIDAKGHCVQTMRSWATLMPGETFGCIGCHESKLEAAPVLPISIASKTGPQVLTPFYGPARGFSYTREIQPIWDKKCVSCHSGQQAPDLRSTLVVMSGHAYNRSYLDLTEYSVPFGSTKWVKWMGAECASPLKPPYPVGAHSSPVVSLLETGHRGCVMTTEEMEKICCWIDLFIPFKGKYAEFLGDSGQASEYNYWANNRKFAEKEDSTNIVQFIQAGQPYGSTGIANQGPSNFQRTTPSGNRSKTYKILSVGASGRLSGTGFDKQVRVYDVRGALVPLQSKNGRFYATRVAPGQYVVVPVK
jgi:hypothetical protein